MSSTKNLAQSAHKYLPEDILRSDILPRLPTKSLLRFKIVSKQWNSLIVSTPFAILRKSKSKTNDAPLVHLLIQNTERYIGNGLYDFKLKNDQSNALVASIDKISHEFEEHSYLVGTVHGLICYAILVRRIDFRLWNPITRELCDIDGPDGFAELLYRPVHWGFGYVSKIDDYKILVISTKKSSKKEFVIHVLTLKTNSTWRKLDHIDVLSAHEDIEFMTSPFDFLFKDVAVLVGQQLFWTICIGDSDGGPALFAFDLEYETFSVVPLPSSISKSCFDFFVSDIGHRLCACWCTEEEDYFEAWILERYGEWESWKFYFKIRVQSQQNHRLCLYPLISELHDNSGRLLIHDFLGFPSCVFDPYSYNEEPQQIIENGKMHNKETFCILNYTESIVSPFSYVKRESTTRTFGGANAGLPYRHLTPAGKAPLVYAWVEDWIEVLSTLFMFF